MKNRLLVLVFFISTLSAYAQNTSSSEYNFMNSTIPVLHNEQLLFPISTVEDTTSNEEIYGAFFGRNKIALDFTPNIPIYGIPFLLDSIPNIVSSGLPFGLDEFLSKDTFGGATSWDGVVNNIILESYPTIDFGSGDPINTTEVLKDVQLNIRAKPGSFGMKFNYDFVVTPWLAVAFDVNFAIGGVLISGSTGIDVKNAFKTVAKSQLQEHLKEQLEDLGLSDLNDLSPEEWQDLVGDLSYEDLGFDDPRLDDLIEELGHPSEYEDFDEFFDKLYDSETFQDYLTSGDLLGGDLSMDMLSTVSSTSTITDDYSSDSDMTSELLKAAINGAFENIAFDIGLTYAFVDHSLGLKFFPGKRAPWGFYVMPKIGISYINISAYCDLDVDDALFDVLAESGADFNKNDFPLNETLIEGWGAYAGLELGWQIQLAPTLTKDWPVEIGLDIALFDFGYYFYWSDSLAQLAIKDMIPSEFEDFSWALNLRGTFLPRFAVSIRF